MALLTMMALLYLVVSQANKAPQQSEDRGESRVAHQLAPQESSETTDVANPSQFGVTSEVVQSSTVEFHPVPHRGRAAGVPPEWFLLATDIVAEVVIEKIYPERFDTSTGLIPTPFPTDFVPKTPFGPSPTYSIQFTPIRLRVTRFHRSNVANVLGFVVPQWNPDVVDPIVGVLRGDKEPEIDMAVVHEGDAALVSLDTSNRLALDPGPWRDFLVNEAGQLNKQGGVLYRPAVVERWYRITSDGQVLDDQLRQVYPLAGLRATLEARPVEPTSTPAPPWSP